MSTHYASSIDNVRHDFWNTVISLVEKKLKNVKYKWGECSAESES